VIRLEDGEDVKMENPGRPNANFDPFVMSVLRQIGMGLNIPFEILVKHFSASYSASRAAIMQAWEFFKSERVWFIEKFCQPIYEEWLTTMVATGKIQAPGFLQNVEIRRAFCECDWHGPVPIQIDPVKEVTAATGRINAKLSTVSEETAMLTGQDYEANFYQLQKEAELATKLGLNDVEDAIPTQVTERIQENEAQPVS